jgi:hypothetical protein
MIIAWCILSWNFTNVSKIIAVELNNWKNVRLMLLFQYDRWIEAKKFLGLSFLILPSLSPQFTFSCCYCHFNFIVCTRSNWILINIFFEFATGLFLFDFNFSSMNSIQKKRTLLFLSDRCLTFLQVFSFWCRRMIMIFWFCSFISRQ